MLYPAYIRGVAYLQMHEGRLAAAEFEKLLANRGLVGTSVTGALSHVQLDRAQRLMGEEAAARKSYEDFLTLWKDADPDIPIYQQAKVEYVSFGPDAVRSVQRPRTDSSTGRFPQVAHPKCALNRG